MKALVIATGEAINTSWRHALVDAERKLAVARREVRDLELAILTIKERVENGDPWPGESTTNEDLPENMR